MRLCRRPRRSRRTAFGSRSIRRPSVLRGARSDPWPASWRSKVHRGWASIVETTGRSRQREDFIHLPHRAPAPMIGVRQRPDWRPCRMTEAASRAPTDVSNPQYYHKVVDCQYACPAHTNVPEYIRLVAQGRFGDAYLLNRESNVFPGILGRVCDRPCEPACRRKRVEEKPVAICRLKRVAADHRGDIESQLPQPAQHKNGRRIALIGAGCASLTVANDLAPLGYDCVIFEALDRPGGLMRTNIPAFRLPTEVLDEEIGYVTRLGVELKTSSPVASLRALLDDGYDAVFVGSGAPKGKNL